MPLPSCICVAGRPPFDRLNDIFCALTQVDLECVTPVLLTASVNGNLWTLVFSERVSGFVAGANGFDAVIEGNPAVFNYTSGNGTTTIILTSDIFAAPGDTIILLSYTPGVIANRECPLEMIIDFEITNSTFTYVQPDGFAYLQPDGVSLYLQP